MSHAGTLHASVERATEIGLTPHRVVSILLYLGFSDLMMSVKS